jgi:hypothetical protein
MNQSKKKKFLWTWILIKPIINYDSFLKTTSGTVSFRICSRSHALTLAYIATATILLSPTTNFISFENWEFCRERKREWWGKKLLAPAAPLIPQPLPGTVFSLKLPLDRLFLLNLGFHFIQFLDLRYSCSQFYRVLIVAEI